MGDWNKLTDKEKSDQLNADLNRMRSGGKTDTRRETGRDSLPLPLSPMVLCREPEQHLVAPTR